jgi:hypothetical protein
MIQLRAAIIGFDDHRTERTNGPIYHGHIHRGLREGGGKEGVLS